MELDNSVSITTWLLAGRPENRCSISDRDRDLSSARLSDWLWGPLSLLSGKYPESLPPRVEQAVRGADHSLLPSLQSSNSILPYDFLTQERLYVLLPGNRTLRIALIGVYWSCLQ